MYSAVVYEQTLQKIGREVKPDREGLFDFLREFIRTTKKSRDLSTLDAEAKIQTYTQSIREFCQTVQVSYSRGIYTVHSSSTSEFVYKNLIYGSSWFEGDPNLHAVIAVKIFWGSAS